MPYLSTVEIRYNESRFNDLFAAGQMYVYVVAKSLFNDMIRFNDVFPADGQHRLDCIGNLNMCLMY